MGELLQLNIPVDAGVLKIEKFSKTLPGGPTYANFFS